MANILSASSALAKSWWLRAAETLSGAIVLALSLPVAALAQGAKPTGNPNFTAAPVPMADGSEGDMIFGIPANTIFFVAVALIGVFWFTFGGGRKAKFQRPQ